MFSPKGFKDRKIDALFLRNVDKILCVFGFLILFYVLVKFIEKKTKFLKKNKYYVKAINFFLIALEFNFILAIIEISLL
jgi:hypothetical protein